MYNIKIIIPEIANDFLSFSNFVGINLPDIKALNAIFKREKVILFLEN